jgi:hypothetical protein
VGVKGSERANMNIHTSMAHDHITGVWVDFCPSPLTLPLDTYDALFMAAPHEDMKKNDISFIIKI